MCRMIPFASASVGECLIIQGIYRTRASDIFKSNRMPLLTFHAARVEIQLTDALVFFLFSFYLFFFFILTSRGNCSNREINF